MATAHHMKCLNNMCRICGNRAQTNAQSKKGPAKYCEKYQLQIFEFYGVDISNDQAEIHPTKICEKCYRRILNYKHSTSVVSVKYDDEKVKAENVSALWEEHDDSCGVCSSYMTQSKPGTKFREPRGRPASTAGNSSFSKDATDFPAPITSTPVKQAAEVEVQTSPSLMMLSFHSSSKPRPPSTSEPSVKQCLQRSFYSPLNKDEERLHTSLTRRKLNFSRDKTVMYCKTRGQPLVFKRLRKSRKANTVVSHHVLKKRAQEVASCRRLIGGQSLEASIKQQAGELKSLPKATLQRVCEKAGIKNKFLVTTHQILAMKTSLGLSWMQCRKQKRYLASLGIKTASEHRQRTEQKSILGDHLEGGMVTLVEKMESAPDSRSGVVERKAAYAQVANLSNFVCSRLEDYDKTHRLTWHGGAIPDDEIWVKLGGDHGGGSFKMALQILNLNSPNAKENTIAILCFEGKDNNDNLDRMVGIQKHQVQQLSKTTWRSKQIKVFLFGDYAFLTKMYGLSGVHGTFGCLWCLTPNAEIQIEREVRGRSRSRKLSSIKQDHHQFITKGMGKKVKASQYNNCIREPLWDVPVRCVCPPYLHILLSIVKRHHDLLESECHQLDVAIAKDIAKTSMPLNDTLFHKHVQLYRDISELRERRRQIVGEFELLEETTPIAILQQEEDRLKQSIGQLDVTIDARREATAADLAVTSGPVTSNLESVLQRHGIAIQAYHSRSFVGNHCSQYLKETVYTDLCLSIPQKTAKLSESLQIRQRADAISSKFRQLMSLFSAVHRAVSHCNAVPFSEVDAIQELIDNYLAFYRQNFPMQILPKHHFLEDHVAEWIKRWGFGMGFHGEQGGEALHAEFNILRRRAHGIQNRAEQLLSVMKEHHTKTSSIVQEHVIQPKKRKTF